MNVLGFILIPILKYINALGIRAVSLATGVYGTNAVK
jgi:hypothetical protein